VELVGFPDGISIIQVDSIQVDFMHLLVDLKTWEQYQFPHAWYPHREAVKESYYQLPRLWRLNIVPC
jgi:hypothetical protein